MTKQVDNANPKAKLDLRRYFLRRYHAESPPHVIDCCQGDGLLWRTLRGEFKTASYWGMDLKVRRGRMKIDSARVLEQPGWRADVIDVDTYGSPWRHWHNLIRTAPGPVTVFLTDGSWHMGVDKTMLAALGLGKLAVPPGIAIRLREPGMLASLGAAVSIGLEIVEAIEAESGRNVRYFGVRLTKKTYFFFARRKARSNASLPQTFIDAYLTRGYINVILYLSIGNGPD